jgi:hypothetical protein
MYTDARYERERLDVPQALDEEVLRVPRDGRGVGVGVGEPRQ